MPNIVLKHNSDLTKKEIDEMYKLNCREYPAFASVYEKNKYYSYIKPDFLGLIYEEEKLIGDFNIGFRNLMGHKISFSGILVDSNYHGKGIGTMAYKLIEKETKSRESSGNFSSTQNPVMVKLLQKLGYKEITLPIFWKNLSNNLEENIQEKGYRGFFKFYNSEFEEIILNSKRINLGDGPI